MNIQDWLGLLAVRGTLKSLLQHHSWKASSVWCSAFFIYSHICSTVYYSFTHTHTHTTHTHTHTRMHFFPAQTAQLKVCSPRNQEQVPSVTGTTSRSGRCGRPAFPEWSENPGHPQPSCTPGPQGLSLSPAGTHTSSHPASHSSGAQGRSHRTSQTGPSREEMKTICLHRSPLRA